MTIFGALRIKNEARWIERVLLSMQSACEHIFVLDDHSTDETAKICAEIPNVTVCLSPFEGIDERRDKDFLLSRVFDAVPQADQHFCQGNPDSPYWCLLLDGDEELVKGGAEVMQASIASGAAHSYSLRILYLWDSPRLVRVDGVYRDFNRPSLFRLMNRNFRFQGTPWGNGANFHCSSIPQELLHGSARCDAKLLHYGYMNREDRLRKYEWYNAIDGENDAEDGYRHVVQGDIPEVPAWMRLRWAGPLTVEAL